MNRRFQMGRLAVILACLALNACYSTCDPHADEVTAEAEATAKKIGELPSKADQKILDEAADISLAEYANELAQEQKELEQ